MAVPIAHSLLSRHPEEEEADMARGGLPEEEVRDHSVQYHSTDKVNIPSFLF